MTAVGKGLEAAGVCGFQCFLSCSEYTWPHLPGMQRAAAPPPQLLGEHAPPLQAGEGRKPSGGDMVYSLFPPENSDVIYGRWEDQIIFDPDVSGREGLSTSCTQLCHTSPLRQWTTSLAPRL